MKRGERVGVGGENEGEEIHTISQRRMQVCRTRLVQLLSWQWSKDSIRRIYMFCGRRWQITRQHTVLLLNGEKRFS